MIKRNRFGAGRSAIDQRYAQMVLKGLTLSLSAPSLEQSERAANLTWEIFEASALSLFDLEDLKAAALAGMVSKDSSEVPS